MFKLVLLSCVGFALAAGPGGNQDVVPIVSQQSDINPDGTFVYSYESGDGSSAKTQGQLVKSLDPKEPDAIGHTGSFQYQSPTGERIETTYVADENGFHPQGAHLPQSPPIPEAIQRALKYIAEHPPPPERN